MRFMLGLVLGLVLSPFIGCASAAMNHYYKKGSNYREWVADKEYCMKYSAYVNGGIANRMRFNECISDRGWFRY